jgi:hypothetical protein
MPLNVLAGFLIRIGGSLTPGQDAALGKSIEQFGVRERLVLDQDLEIMDGRDRLRWCRKLASA